MTHHDPRRLSLTFALALVLVASAALSASQEGSYDRIYRLDHLQPRVAELLLWELCDRLGGDEVCRVRTTTDNGLAVVGPDAFHEAAARMIAEKDVNPRPTQTFLISLVAATQAGSGMDEDIPEAAAAALADVADFMPYSRFDLVDTGWVRTSRSGNVRMGDENGNSYEMRLSYQAVQEIDGVELDLGGFEVARIHPSGEHQNLISTSLRMGLGETVVVGTSKPDGRDAALVAVLSAVP